MSNDPKSPAGDARARFEKKLAKAKAGARDRHGLLAAMPGGLPADADDLYDAATLAAQGFDPERDLGLPGEPPFTRGVQPNMYRGRPRSPSTRPGLRPSRTRSPPRSRGG